MKQRGKRRAGVGMVLSLMVILLIAACGKKQPEEEVTRSELYLWYYWDDMEARRCLLEMVEAFNRLHPETEVVPHYVPDEDFKKTLALAVADHAMPDLAIVDSSDVQYYHAMGALKDVSKYVAEEKYLESALASCRVSEQQYVGLPIGLSCLVFYYNEELLAQAGVAVPETLDEFVQAAQQVSSEDVFGCAFPSLQSEESSFCFLPILWAKGGSVQEINSPESREAFDFLRRLVDCGAMSKRSVNMTLSDITGEFAKGKVAMMFGTSGKEQMLRDLNPELRFGVREIPSGDQPISVIGGEVLTVTSTEHVTDAMSFVAFMAGQNQIKDYTMRTGMLSPRWDILQWQVEQETELKKYVSYLKNSNLRELSPTWPAISIAISETINEIILQTDDPEILDALAETIRRIQEERDGSK